jgi:hypothetical protein
MGHGICQLWVQGLVGCECLADLFGDGVGGHAVASEGEVFHAVAFVWVPSWMLVVVVVTWTRWPLTVAETPSVYWRLDKWFPTLTVVSSLALVVRRTLLRIRRGCACLILR